MILIFIGPALLYYGIFIVYPVLSTVFNAFHTIQPQRGRLVTTFVGLRNFRELLKDEIFSMSVRHTLIWAVVGPIIEMITAVTLAFIVYFRVPFSKVYRIAWFSPLLVQGVIVGLIYRWIFNNEWVLLNTFLQGVGLGSLATNWLGTPGVVLGCVIFAHYWATFGFSFVLILMGLSTVEEELLDSAAIDGANRRQVSLRILLPLITPVFFTAIMLSFLGKMRSFNIVWVLTRGGPMHLSETVATYVQKRAFQWNTLDLGYPSAIALMWFGVVMVIIALASRWFRRQAQRVRG